MGQFFAHTKPDRPEEEWQRLDDHLRGVAELAERFATAFDSGPWGLYAGTWHDLGKFSNAFQRYLRESGDPSCSTRIDHSTAGAQHARAADDLLGHLLAYAIAGHHGGLPGGRSEDTCLEKRLKKSVEPWRTADASLLLADLETSIPRVVQSALSQQDRRRAAFSLSFFVRMLFSCLVDADFLDTERFMSSDRHARRAEWPADVLLQMSRCLDDHVAGFGPPASNVNRQRARVLKDCRKAIDVKPGHFSLTVPTGGGKTLSSLAFALRHAIRHRLERVIYVIPFTSIIEQNADVFREAMRPLAERLGTDPVLEHHSNLDLGEETVISRLATENWDAPLVVTTSVQFYESLFANRPGKCRKLHNVARSVIILDEAQTLPVTYLEPCLTALDELARHYGTSVVLCTATQPAVSRRSDFSKGLENVREIVSDTRTLYHSLRRVEVEKIGKQDDSALVKRMREAKQTLCVVNTRSHARKLFEELGDGDGHYHLSTLMVPEHRSEVLREIRNRLDSGMPCRVISTQLVEAGVDIDFPVVLRSMAGIDSIAQAAGRCNRNGKLLGMGKTLVFHSEHQRSEQYFAETAGCAAQVMECRDDPLSLEAVEHYFSLYYWSRSNLDEKDIMDSFRLDGRDKELPFSFDFATVAREFRLIEDSGRAVIVPWGATGCHLCEQLRRTAEQPGRDLLRKLQRYTVRLHEHEWQAALAAGAVELVGERFAVLVSPELHYSNKTGLSTEGGSPAVLCV